MTAIWTYLCHIERLSHVDILSEVFKEACVRSSMPIVLACFADAWFIRMSSVWAI